ncbi:DUF222 domain-containing protein [Demequina sp. NBRC 110056]|uniref:HNH endonuclease n=1 Tax=Demequina sp. NBRC 110056 TaxID=1570345 RepID=UPI000A06983B|nr:DUF222 domain-containing protein [Demequina sp. NBRC 110056]
MTQTPTLLDIAGGDAGAPAPGDWDARARAALVERKELTHAGVSGLSDDDLVALGAAVAAVRKDADRMMGVVAAEQAARSRAKSRSVGLARKRGKGDERGLVSAQTGGSNAEAGRLIELGEMLRDAEKAELGASEPRGEAESPNAAPPAAEARPVFPVVAAAVKAGELSTEASTMITRMLTRVGKRIGDAAMAVAEKDLVFSARYMRLEKLAGLITRTEERLDREHREQLAQERRERRYLRIGEAADGMITINGRLDPENGVPLVSLLHAMVNQNFRLRKRMQDAAKAGESVVIDERTPEQVRADALGDFARHVAGCDVEVLPRSGATLVLRTDVKDLREGLAGASIDGLSASVDAGTLRRMAAAAGIIPQVMDGKSVVLDQGRRTQYFTRPQKLALVERDGGCAMCGAPPSWCDAHHIVHWSRGGPTDLSNGVLLCVRCHHDLHRAGWKIDATPEEVWFTPPAEVDPERRRRPGGRRLFDAYPLEPESDPDPGGASEALLLDDPALLDDNGEVTKNCGLESRQVCVSVPADLDDEPAPGSIERELEELVQSELERWLEEALRSGGSGTCERAPGRAAKRRDGPAHLHSQATRRTIDA